MSDVFRPAHRIVFTCLFYDILKYLAYWHTKYMCDPKSQIQGRGVLGGFNCVNGLACYSGLIGEFLLGHLSILKPENPYIIFNSQFLHSGCHSVIKQLR